ncbi:uncharacterized protein TRAVEDRAFT_39145 [Trametes versicolor FP-101664 SS1]|uniref:uncharacterized protein n=1 Tax=Trametes versicolor (strain FP-101664) TaxID=717944 RepID=UPI0004623F23|nr:uncharacterized protein TRAVEDRAFT_39145 [Trametes versicolor FP-101664 SS1]EIW56131.1 hypothetical protein TRAVEDRAFT_39145 [Trametes versicolor FP-101664 SS1]
MQHIVVDAEDTKLSYIDSGVPHQATDGYKTIFAVHGTVFTSPIFEKVMALAQGSNIRIVAVNRRDYPGSTPLTTEDTAILASGSDEQKAAFLKARGVEVATFIDLFVERNGVPPISPDGHTGGFALLGWSLGNAIALSAVANVESLPPAAQDRWTSGMRALILHEPLTVAIGSPLPPKVWSPQIDQTIPEELRGPFFTQWITSYFKHGDLSTRSLDVLSYIVPTTLRVPSIFSMTEEEQAKIVYMPPGSASDMLFMVFSAAQINASYKRACFDAGVRARLPRMKICAFTGDATCVFSLPAHWAMQDDDKARGGGFIDFKMVEGANHFLQWDSPELALETYRAAM